MVQVKHLSVMTQRVITYTLMIKLFEVYVTPFADAVDAGVACFMGSYNKFNGQFACGNESILKKIL